MKSTFEYGDGNVLSYAEHGDPFGYPILVQHGLIASIGDYQLFEWLIQSGMRVISIARPGYGDSSPYQMSTIGEWGDIVARLADRLEIACCDVLGISSGAPYSYAVGYAMQDSVRNIFILAGIPYLNNEHVLRISPRTMPENATIPELQRQAHDLFFANVSQDAALSHDVVDSMRNDCFGIALDFSLRYDDWGFSLSDNPSRVYMQHSRADSQVPFAAAYITSRLLPNCRFLPREHDDHFSTEILDDFIRTVVLQPELVQERENDRLAGMRS